MALEINGYSGGYPVQQPGDFGRNAMMSFLALPPGQAAFDDLRYTAADNFTSNNSQALRADLQNAADNGFATLLSQLGARSFRAMTIQDVTQLLSGNWQLAQKIMQALDVANDAGQLTPDGKIDFHENRAYMAFQDAPHKIWLEAMEVLGSSTNESQGQNALYAANMIRQHYSSQGGNPMETCDGVLTANERTVADMAVDSSPNVVHMILQRLYQKVN